MTGFGDSTRCVHTIYIILECMPYGDVVQTNTAWLHLWEQTAIRNGPLDAVKHLQPARYSRDANIARLSVIYKRLIAARKLLRCRMQNFRFSQSWDRRILVRKLRIGGSNRRSALGPGKYRGLWRRRGQGHPLRARHRGGLCGAPYAVTHGASSRKK